MKYIKTYEIKNNLPKIDDYVVISPDFEANSPLADDHELTRFIGSNIGQIIKFYHYTENIVIRVAYDDVPETIREWFGFDHSCNKSTLSFNVDQIVEFSKNKEDLEYIVQSNKFNL